MSKGSFPVDPVHEFGANVFTSAPANDTYILAVHEIPQGTEALLFFWLSTDLTGFALPGTGITFQVNVVPKDVPNTAALNAAQGRQIPIGSTGYTFPWGVWNAPLVRNLFFPENCRVVWLAVVNDRTKIGALASLAGMIRPFGAALWGEASNCRKLLRSKAAVVNVPVKRRGIWIT